MERILPQLCACVSQSVGLTDTHTEVRENAKRIPLAIFSSVACLAIPSFSTLSQTA